MAEMSALGKLLISSPFRAWYQRGETSAFICWGQLVGRGYASLLARPEGGRENTAMDGAVLFILFKGWLVGQSAIELRA